ncbi:MAG TPA: DUF5047 domain-containing protein [Streptosporangiaceae bacterium]|jgi:hypothetical protein
MSVTAPTFTAAYQVSSWTTTTSPKTASPTVAADDVLLVLGGSEDYHWPLATPSGGGLPWALLARVALSEFCPAYTWWAAGVAAGSPTVTGELTTGGGEWGFGILRFSGSDGIGATAAKHAAGAPSLDITTKADHSALAVIVLDWNAADGSSRTWRTVNGITPSPGGGDEITYARDSGKYAVYAAYYSDAGTAGVKTVGLSAPGGQKYSILAVEVKGHDPAASGTPTAPPAAVSRVSDAFLRTIRGSHTIAVQAVALDSFQTGISPAGTEVTVTGGDVLLDGTADVRGTLDLVTDATGWDPRPGAHILQPYGTEVFVRRGAVVSGSVEWVSLGYYRIQSAARDKLTGQLAIAGSDRMQAIIDAQLPTPVQFGAGTSVEAIFTELVTGVYPGAVIEYDFDAAADTLTAAATATGDRYGFLRQLATSRGKIMYFDYRGILVVKDLPAASDPVWEATSGPGGVLITQTDTLDRDGVYNAVTAMGDGASTDTPPVAVAYDSSPDSPTYYYGPFGQVPDPQPVSSPLIETAAQAAAAASMVLAKTTGLPYQADFTAVPNPALQPLDPIALDGGSVHVLQQVTIPFTAAEALTGTTREQGGVAVEAVDLTVSQWTAS